jgi:ABC-2 type transport system permease protein
MSGSIIVELLRHEWRGVVRAPAIWISLLLLLACGTWGALNGSRLHAHQAADLARMTESEAAWYADVRLRAVGYAQPSTTSVPYWQDPTGASGFSRYFLRRFAAKPHLPLSILAVGQSDVQPFAVPLRLETLFGGDRVYDYQPPRSLTTGLFDLSFVVVFVLPLVIGAATAAIGGIERDRGILPLIAAQSISPQRWWFARLTAVASLFVPAVALIAAIALAIAGVPIWEAPAETLAALALISCHTLVWISIAALCLRRGMGGVAATAATATTWLLLTVAVPLAASLSLHWTTPAPSPVGDVNELRRTTDAVQREADALVIRRLDAQLGSPAPSIDPSSLDYSTRLVLITQEMEERLAPQEDRRRRFAHASDSIASIASWLSPQLLVHTALTDVAGTGTTRHQAFLAQVRAFQLELRAFMYPRVLAAATSTLPKVCPDCPGRLTFTDYDEIPRFTMQDAPASARVASALRAAAWLAVLAMAIAVIGIGGGTTWSLGE